MINMKSLKLFFVFITLAVSILSCSKRDEHIEVSWKPAPVQDGVPVVEVYVDGGEEIVSKDDYLKATIVITEDGKPSFSSRGKIKGRKIRNS